METKIFIVCSIVTLGCSSLAQEQPNGMDSPWSQLLTIDYGFGSDFRSDFEYLTKATYNEQVITFQARTTFYSGLLFQFIRRKYHEETLTSYGEFAPPQPLDSPILHSSEIQYVKFFGDFGWKYFGGGLGLHVLVKNERRLYNENSPFSYFPRAAVWAGDPNYAIVSAEFLDEFLAYGVFGITHFIEAPFSSVSVYYNPFPNLESVSIRGSFMFSATWQLRLAGFWTTNGKRVSSIRLGIGYSWGAA